MLAILLLFARGMDFLSTWVATPHLVLEGNPIAKWLGWKWGAGGECRLVRRLRDDAVPAIIVATTSVLVAARNFQSAWLMRSLGEDAYRDWYVAPRSRNADPAVSVLPGGQHAAHGGRRRGVDLVLRRAADRAAGIGMGIVAYAVAVIFYTLLSVWRSRRRRLELNRRKRRTESNDMALPAQRLLRSLCFLLFRFEQFRKMPGATDMITPSLDEFLKLAGQGNLIPVTMPHSRRHRNAALGVSQNPRAGRIVPVRIRRRRRTPRALLVRRLQSARGHQADGQSR